METALNSDNSTLCFYCGENPSIPARKYEKSMYFVTEKTNNFNSVSIRYNESKVPIARCETCQTKHDQKWPTATLAILSIGVWCYYRFFYFWPEETGEQVVAYIISVFAVAILFALLEWIWNLFFHSLVFKIPPADKVATHLDIIRMEDQGWLRTKPSAKTAQVSKPKRRK